MREHPSSLFLSHMQEYMRARIQQKNEISPPAIELIIRRPQRKNRISTSFCFSVGPRSQESGSASRQINRSRYSACLYLSSFIIAARRARGSPLHHVFIGRARKEAQVKLFIASYQQLVQHFDYPQVCPHHHFWMLWESASWIFVILKLVLLAVWLNSFSMVIDRSWLRQRKVSSGKFVLCELCCCPFIAASDAFVYILNKQECVNTVSVDKSIFGPTDDVRQIRV